MSLPSLKETLSSERLLSLDSVKLASYNSRREPKFNSIRNLGRVRTKVTSTRRRSYSSSPIRASTTRQRWTIITSNGMAGPWSGLHPDAPPVVEAGGASALTT